MANNLKGITVKIGGDTVDLQKALKNVNKTSNSLQSELTQINRQLKFDPSSATLLAQKEDVLKDSIESAKDKLKELEAVQDDIERQYKSGDIDDGQYRAFQREVEQTKSKLNGYENQLKHTSEQQEKFKKEVAQAKQTLSENKKEFAQAAKTAAKWGTAVGAAAVTASSAVVKYAADYETAFAKVSTLLSDTTDLDNYKQDILKTSNEIAVSATDTAEAVYQALSASVDENSAVDFTEKAYKLAKGGFTELETSVDVLTTAINAYKLSASDAEHISDVLITTQNKGKTTVDQLASKMGKVIPVAAAYNVSLEQLGTGYAILTAKGLNTANTTTQLKSMFNELSNSGKAVAMRLKSETGKSFSQLQKEGKTLYDVLDILNKSVKGNKDEFGDLWKNANAKSAALSLLDSGAEKFNETLNLMTNSAGTSEKAYEKMSNTAEHKLEKIKVNIENSAITIGNSLLPTVSDLLDEVENNLPAIQKMAENLGNAIGDDIKWCIKNGDTLLKTVKAIGVGTVGIYTAIKAYNATKFITSTVNAFKTLKTATEGATVAQLALNTAEKANVIGLVVSGLVLLGTALYEVYDITHDTSDATDDLNANTEKLLQTMSDETAAWDEISESRKKSFSETDSEFGYYSDLADELDNITDKNGKIKKGYEDRAKVIVTTLNDALGTEIEINGNVVKSYQEVQDEIDKTIAKKKAEAQLSNAQESYNTALTNQTEAFSNLSNSKDALKSYKAQQKQLKKELKEVEKEYNKTTQTTTGLKRVHNSSDTNDPVVAKYKALLGSINLYDKKIASTNKKIKKYQETYLGYQTTIANYENLTAAATNGNVNEIESAITKLTNNFITAENGTKKSLQNQVTTAKTTYKQLKEALAEGAPGVTAQAVKNAKDLKNQAVAELDKFKDEAKNKAEKAGKNSTKVNTEENKQSATDNTKDLLNNVKTAYSEGVESAKTSAESAGSDIVGATASEKNKEKSKRKGKELAKDFADGYYGYLNQKELANKMSKAAANLVKGALTGVEKTQDSHSPSKETRKLGKYFSQGYSIGIEEEAKSAIEKAKQLSNASLNVLNRNSNTASSANSNVNSKLKQSAENSVISKSSSNTYYSSPSVNIKISGVTVRDDSDIEKLAKTIAPYVSENLAAVIEREGGSLGL